MASEKKPNVLERFIIFSDTDTNTLKIISYGIATTSLIVALYTVRPFAKFRKPSSIPSRFLQKRTQLRGTVIRVEPSCGTLLMVDHKPLIPLPWFGSPTYLPVKIAGVDVTGHGISWLQTIVKGKEITFVPLAKEKDYVSCLVSLQQNQDHIKLGVELTKLGFALIKEDSLNAAPDDKNILNYKKCLLKAQKGAERKRNGHWHFARHPTLLWRIQQSLNEKVKSMLPKFIVQQLNI